MQAASRQPLRLQRINREAARTAVEVTVAVAVGAVEGVHPSDERGPSEDEADERIRKS